MRTEGAIFPVHERTLGGCIDLALLFVRRHWPGVLRLTACFAVPFCGLSWWLLTRGAASIGTCLVLFALLSSLLGAALVGSAGARVFGDRFSVGHGLLKTLERLPLLVVLMTLTWGLSWIGSLFLVIPGYLIATRYGFLSEVLLLENCRLRSLEKRITNLLADSFSRLVGRLLGVVLFFAVTVACLFLLIDTAAGLLFNFPILLGRSTGLSLPEMIDVLVGDPRLGSVLLALMWLVYPVARLAWMFCYLDQRIRREGWDVELDFRIEARRLQEAA